MVTIQLFKKEITFLKGKKIKFTFKSHAMNHIKKRQKVKVFALRIVTSVVGKTTRVGSEKHGCFGNSVIRDIFC